MTFLVLVPFIEGYSFDGVPGPPFTVTEPDSTRHVTVTSFSSSLSSPKIRRCPYSESPTDLHLLLLLFPQCTLGIASPLFTTRNTVLLSVLLLFESSFSTPTTMDLKPDDLFGPYSYLSSVFLPRPPSLKPGPATHRISGSHFMYTVHFGTITHYSVVSLLSQYSFFYFSSVYLLPGGPGSDYGRSHGKSCVRV